MSDFTPLIPSTQLSSLGVYHLHRLWSATQAARSGIPAAREGEEFLDRMVLDALGLGLHQTIQYLYQTGPSLIEFEAWIVETAGPPHPDRVARLNAHLQNYPLNDSTQSWLNSIENRAPVLTADELSFWDEHGYLILSNGVVPEVRQAAETAIWEYLGARLEDLESWYAQKSPGIMVELIQHPALEAVRRSPRIHQAFAQLWNTADLWVTADRCGFHPPQRADCPFPGPDLHWDLDFSQPLTFGTQGILYLTDTPPEQGALTLVPGFHRKLADWLAGLERGSDPQQQDLHALGSVPIGGKAGDLIIWNQALPHGSRPNLGKRPRMVQYINLYPGRENERRGDPATSTARRSPGMNANPAIE